MGSKGVDDHPTYTVKWSEDDGEYVATVDSEPFLSYLSKYPVGALVGLRQVML